MLWQAGGGEVVVWDGRRQACGVGPGLEVRCLVKGEVNLQRFTDIKLDIRAKHRVQGFALKMPGRETPVHEISGAPVLNFINNNLVNTHKINRLFFDVLTKSWHVSRRFGYFPTHFPNDAAAIRIGFSCVKTRSDLLSPRSCILPPECYPPSSAQTRRQRKLFPRVSKAQNRQEEL